MIQFANIPLALRERPQWVLWRVVKRKGEPTKVPYQPNGAEAKSNDPATWSSFDAVREAYDPGRHAGIGYVFAADDPFTGIDLDGCRDPETGRVAEWAREIVCAFATYGEVSPSHTGLKLFAVGKSPFDKGRNVKLTDVTPMCEKAPGIEVYDRGRFFAVTGLRLVGPAEPAEAPQALAALKARIDAAREDDKPPPATRAPDFNSPAAVVERARKYLAKIEPAVSGQNGHNQTFRAACILVLGFELAHADAVALLTEWNVSCVPPWDHRDIERKAREAAKQGGPRGYLRDVPPSNWDAVEVPHYGRQRAQSKSATTGPKVTTMAAASRAYFDSIRSGVAPLATTSIPELDAALEGGIAFGEMAMFAARPSHGKSAFALQALHHWTAKSNRHSAPAVIISEEMGQLMLGKRTVQFVTELHQSVWAYEADRIESELREYAATRHDCFIVEGCGSTAAAVAAVERHVAEHGCRYAVVDYAQLLRSPGGNRYEQVTNTSVMLKSLATRTNVVLLVLAQLSRAVEQRGGEFAPVMSDLKESGQLEQDADVIVFQCWPNRLNSSEPKSRYQFFAMKNRNRDIRSRIVECRFAPDRQMLRGGSDDAQDDSVSGGVL